MKADGDISSRSEGNLPDFLTKWKLLQMALRDTRLGRSRLPAAVLQCLIEHDGPGGCFPGMRRLAKLCNADYSGIKRTSKLLKVHGYIDWKRRWNNETGALGSNLYSINYDKVPDAKEPNPLPECEEEAALEETAKYIEENFGCDADTAVDVADSIRARLNEESANGTIGRHLFKLLRDAEHYFGLESDLDSLVKDRLAEIRN